MASTNSKSTPKSNKDSIEEIVEALAAGVALNHTSKSVLGYAKRRLLDDEAVEDAAHQLRLLMLGGRKSELVELNFQIAKNGWHKEDAYKMYPYILERIASIESEEAGNGRTA